MFFPKEHRKRCKKAHFARFYIVFAFSTCQLRKKKEHIVSKGTNLLVQASHFAHPTDEKGGKRIQDTHSAWADTVAVHILNGRTMTAQNVLHADFCMKKHIQSRDRLYCLRQTVIDSITLAATLMPSSFWTPAEYIRLAP